MRAKERTRHAHGDEVARAGSGLAAAWRHPAERILKAAAGERSGAGKVLSGAGKVLSGANEIPARQTHGMGRNEKAGAGQAMIGREDPARLFGKTTDCLG